MIETVTRTLEDNLQFAKKYKGYYRIVDVIASEFVQTVRIEVANTQFVSEFFVPSLKKALHNSLRLPENQKIVILSHRGFICIQVPSLNSSYTPHLKDLPTMAGGMKVPIGANVYNEPVYVTLDSDHAHLKTLGPSGSAKSNAWKVAAVQWMRFNSPQRVKFLLVETEKGGKDIKLFDGLPHLAHPPVVDVDAAAKVLTWAANENARRNGYTLVLVIDEFAQMMTELKNDPRRDNIVSQLLRIARAGRDMGVFLVLSSQYVNRQELGPDAYEIIKNITLSVFGRPSGSDMQALNASGATGLDLTVLTAPGDMMGKKIIDHDGLTNDVRFAAARLSVNELQELHQQYYDHKPELTVPIEQVDNLDSREYPYLKPREVAAAIYSGQRQLADPKYRDCLKKKGYKLLSETQVRNYVKRDFNKYRRDDEPYLIEVMRELYKLTNRIEKMQEPRC